MADSRIIAPRSGKYHPTVSVEQGPAWAESCAVVHSSQRFVGTEPVWATHKGRRECRAGTSKGTDNEAAKIDWQTWDRAELDYDRQPYFFTSTTGDCSEPTTCPKNSRTRPYSAAGTVVAFTSSDRVKRSLSPFTA
jgi:hypothetical protein